VRIQTSCGWPVERPVGTVGRVHPHLEIKIVDGDGSDRAAPNAGQILKRAGRGSPQPVAINSYQGR
jgi:fatty-acyl-CoA synthase